ncbi:MAG: UDP-N-acetylmuramoyl-tripeptide--D-alanyl-D-alanine ligase, partial [Chromatiales bacterium]|nr:UDP-N-acetylmuramoyl-tripeptide--D-alanyl-D-alanine ligase [Chromatiales bacterium]
FVENVPFYGFGVACIDHPEVQALVSRVTDRRLVTYGQNPQADVRAVDVVMDGPVSRFAVELRRRGTSEMDRIDGLSLPMPGLHNLLNATAAIAVALQLGLNRKKITDGFSAIEPVAGRLQFKRAASGAAVIDDSYNANPESVNAAIEVLATAPGRRFLVLGELAELGAGADSFYRELAQNAKAGKVSSLYTVGGAAVAAEAFGEGARAFADQSELLAVLNGELGATDTVLVKGSRSAAMEQVVNALVNGEGL